MPRRTLAKELCDRGAIRLDNRLAKASSEVVPGQLLVITSHGRIREVEILTVPTGPMSRKEAPGLYCLLKESIEPYLC